MSYRIVAEVESWNGRLSFFAWGERFRREWTHTTPARYAASSYYKPGRMVKEWASLPPSPGERVKEYPTQSGAKRALAQIRRHHMDPGPRQETTFYIEESQ